MTTFLSIISPDNTLSTSCLSSILRLQQSRTPGSIMIDISKSLRESLYKAKQLESLSRVVCLHASCGINSDFITKNHPHPVVTAGYGISPIDWNRMIRDFPYDTEDACKEAGTMYNFDVTKAVSVDSEYMSTDTCEAKIISIAPDSIETVETSLDPDTYILSTKTHVYINAEALHNVEFCFVGSFIEKYGKKKDV